MKMEAINVYRESISGSTAACFKALDKRTTAFDQNKELVSYKSGLKLIKLISCGLEAQGRAGWVNFHVWMVSELVWMLE